MRSMLASAVRNGLQGSVSRVAGYGLAVHRKAPPVPALTAAFSDDERTDKWPAEEPLRRQIKTDMAVPVA